ncbi:MAG TPA: hypothetical protein VNJ51_07065 [Candidatus Dormibacteraeota bacterium]|nr:hypothetical protein [Candidatus Dormibacteraeota bacterium]
MEVEPRIIVCAHGRCSCPVTAASGPESYCSDYCLDAETRPEDEDFCLCGHPECTPEEEEALAEPSAG